MDVLRLFEGGGEEVEEAESKITSPEIPKSNQDKVSLLPISYYFQGDRADAADAAA